MSELPVFGAGIWHFATYVDRYATEGYGEPVGLLEQIDKAGAVGDLSVVDLNWPFAGAIIGVLLLAVLVLVIAFNRVVRLDRFVGQV